MAFLLDQTTLLYILLPTGTGIMFLVLIAWIIRLELKLRRFTLGKDGKSLEELIGHVKQNYEEVNRFCTETEQYLALVDERLRASIQSVATVRFNPFNENSGKQSFATAFVSENGDGVLLSSICARERMNMYAKPLTKFTSSYELSKEEQRALNEARATLNTHNDN